MAEEARLREEQAARDFPREKVLRGISAGNEAFAQSNDFLDLVEKFKEGAKGTYWTVILDPETQSQPVKFLRSPEETISYFEKQLALANTLTQQQKADVLVALKAWVVTA